MKLSDQYRLRDLIHERQRLRTSLGCALTDDDIKVSIQGSEAQGPVRQVCLKAISDMYADQLAANTAALQKLGVEVDDEPVTAQAVKRTRRELQLAREVCG